MQKRLRIFARSAFFELQDSKGISYNSKRKGMDDSIPFLPGGTIAATENP